MKKGVPQAEYPLRLGNCAEVVVLAVVVEFPVEVGVDGRVVVESEPVVNEGNVEGGASVGGP